MKTRLIHGGHVVDPAQDIDRRADVVLRGDQIVGVVEPGSFGDADEMIDATGLVVMPGLIDTQVRVGEPGHERAESILSASRAAVAGGYATILATSDTDPPIDTEAAAEYVFLQAQRASYANVLPIGCITKRREGQELAEIGQLAHAGAVAFGDASRPVANASLFHKALRYASMFDRPVIQSPFEPTLTNGVMHAGYHSIALGMPGIPASGEAVMVARDTLLAKGTGAHVHLATISTLDAVEGVRRAKRDGIDVTCSVTPHHLTLMDEVVGRYDAAAHKVLPPLRSAEHVQALREGLRDGTIDLVTSDHSPHTIEDKQCEFDRAPFGVIGLETTLAVLHTHLVVPGTITMRRLVELLATTPAELARLHTKRSLSRGSDADLTLFDPHATWTVDSSRFQSRSRNTPFEGWTLQGRARYTIVMGRVHDLAAWW